MFAITESYEEIKSALEEILNACHAIAHKGEIIIDGKKYLIEFFLGGDLKFLALIYGINNANSKFPCVWCTCPKDCFSDIKKEWSIQHCEKGARKIENAIDIMNKQIKKKDIVNERMGQVAEPIITFIEFSKCIVDLLHLLLRISDRLIDLFIKRLEYYDGNESDDLSIRPNFNRYISFLKEIPLTNPVYIKTLPDNKKVFKFRNFNGNEKLKIFSQINIVEILSEKIKKKNEPSQKELIDMRKEAVKIDNLWKEFLELFMIISYPDDYLSRLNNLRKKPKYLTFFGPFNKDEIIPSYILPNTVESSRSENDLNSVKVRLFNWHKHFLDLFFEDEITPYIHVFIFHLPEFASIYENVDYFNLQGLESLNKCTIKYYNRSTNRNVKNKSYLRQLILKRSRLEFFQLNGILASNNFFDCFCDFSFE
jgi:hypothetical protein